tara:strand:+ start:571 stop:1923 length:1353 start_codon:yes stop_codon:yes gene_type:complete
MKSIEDKIKLIKSQDPVGQFPIYYKGETRNLNFYELDLDLLRFNYVNGRIGSEVMEHKQIHGRDLKDMDYKEANEIVFDWIWKKDLSSNKKSLTDIRQKGQIKPGVITRDGIIVDGNRRFMLLCKLKETYSSNKKFKAIILDDTYEDGGDKELDIKLLETTLQLGEDEKVSYRPIEKYLTIIKFRENYNGQVSDKKIASLMNLKSVKDVQKNYEIGKLMLDYLDYIGAPNITSRLENTEDLFINFQKKIDLYKRQKGGANWELTKDDEFDYKINGFKLIRWNYNIKNDKDYNSQFFREFYFSTSREKSVITHKKLWDDFNDSMNKLDESTYEVVDVAKEKNISVSEAAKFIDETWANNSLPALKEAVGRAKSKIRDRKNERDPEKFILQALDKIDNLIHEDKFHADGTIEIKKTIFDNLVNENHYERNINNLHKIRKISETLIKEIKKNK